MLRLRLASAVLLAGCLPAFVQPQPADPAAIKAQQRQGFAQSMGYPTKKSSQDLEQTIRQQTEKYKAAGRTRTTQLEAPEPFVFDAVGGTCYTVVMRLGDGAMWGLAGDYLKFDFQRPDTAGSGGPGVVGPGAVASVGCAKSAGPITLTMASMVEGDPLGTGPISMELYTRVLSKAEQKQMAEDEQRQIAEQREFARQEEERQRQRREEEQARRDADRQREASRPSSSSSSSGGSSGPVSVTIRSSCSKTVKVFYGSKPKYGSGTSSSISSNSVQSHSFRSGDMFWITDESGNGLDSVTVDERVRQIEVTSGCTRLSAR